MGLFDFLKPKQKSSVTVSFSSFENTALNYDPWDAKKSNAPIRYANTDYAKAVFLSMHSRKASSIGSSPDDYPRYVSYRLGIVDPIKKYKELLRDGYFRKANPLEILESYSMSDLREILAKKNIEFKGRKKVDIINAISNNIDVEKLNLPVLYCVSEKGLSFISEHEDLVKLDGNSYNISLEEYLSTKEKVSKHLGFNDVIWSVFNFRPASRNNALYRAQFLASENRNVDALSWYITVLYYDVNDKDNDEVAPGIQREIVKLKDSYQDAVIEKCYRRVDLKKSLISPKLFKKLAIDIMEGKEAEFSRYRQ